jgi:hypothetical protein
MTRYYVEFWRGVERDPDYQGDEFDSPKEASEHINDLLHEMISDPWEEDWPGCRFQVMASGGERVLAVPVLAAMSALARKAAH